MTRGCNRHSPTWLHPIMLETVSCHGTIAGAAARYLPQMPKPPRTPPVPPPDARPAGMAGASPAPDGGAPPRPDSQSAAEIAAYISHMARDLAGLARAAKLGALAYLLEMTQVEASSAAQKPE